MHATGLGKHTLRYAFRDPVRAIRTTRHHTLRYRRPAPSIQKIRSTLGTTTQNPNDDPVPGSAAAAAAGLGASPAPADLAARLASVRERVAAAALAAGRPPASVTLLAVTKTFSAATIAAAARLGQRCFGENYAQEAIAKMETLRALPGLPALQWHFIGPLQSNKTRLIAGHFDWVQSIDRLSVAQRLSAQRPAQLAPLQVLIEVNISGEASKSGVAPQDLPLLAQAVAMLPRLRLRGLMAIPAPGQSPALQAQAFARLRAVFAQARAALGAAAGTAAGAGQSAADAFDTLSMGMSADFEQAIAEGSTMVRVGSAIFGERR